ncbi:MAG: hypothetical protein RR494_13155 [Vagococcus sp.]|uniref:hypothetical protein n=2 Tax=Enterococcaceae TaxID=81852 RepID=UPI002FC6BFDF
MILLGFEFKKLLEQPMIIGFLILCLVFNMAWIISVDLNKNYLEMVQSFSLANGSKMTEKTVEQVQELPKENNQKRLLLSIENSKDELSHTSGSQLGEKVTDFYQVTEAFKSDLNKKYQLLETSIQTLVSQQAGADLAVVGETMSFFTFIRNVLLKLLLAEGLIFSLLVGLFASTSESMTKTNKIIFTTKTGRKVQVSKYISGLLLSILFFTLVVLATFLFFNLFYPLGTIWNNSMSTQFHFNVYFPGLLELPFITWLPMTLATHTLFSILLSLLLIIVCFSCHFVMGLWLDHLFKGFVVTVGIVALHKIMVIGAMSKGYWSVFKYLMFSPIEVWENQGYWFTEMGPFSILPFQESLVVAVSLISVLGVLLLTYKYYPKKEVL